MDIVQIMKPNIFVFEGVSHLPMKIQPWVEPIVEYLTADVVNSAHNRVDGIICAAQDRLQLAGLFPASIAVITDEQWHDVDYWDSFLTKLYVLQRLNNLCQHLTQAEIIQFHSRHKYLIMAYSPVGYQLTGRLVASIRKGSDLHSFFNHYKAGLMEIFSSLPARNIQVNALSHMQGYFKRKATSDEKKRLLWLINDYREGNLPISQPLAMMRQLLVQYPDNYLSEQYFFEPYPNCIPIRELPYRW